ncbi:MAG: SagB/ThcOx family dehydrogenase [Planctomycetota bacterium]
MTGRQRSIVEHFHEVTKYSADGIQSLPGPDPSLQPAAFKEYYTKRAIELTPFLPNTIFPAKSAEARQLAQAEKWSGVGRLSRLLYFCYGPTGRTVFPGGQQVFRAAPSAGALFPAEIYVVTNGFPALTDGIYNYGVANHRLVPVFEGDFAAELRAACFQHPATMTASAHIIISGVYQRSTWRYHERAYRRILLDVGHVLGNLVLYAPLEGWQAAPIASFVDDQVNGLFFFAEAEESVLAVVALVAQDALTSTPLSGAPLRRVAPSRFRAAAVSSDEPLYRFAHRATSLTADAETIAAPTPNSGVDEVDRACARRLDERLESLGERLPATIVRRRSTRRFKQESLSRATLAQILWFSNQHVRPPATQVNPLQLAALLDTYVIIQRVKGVEPGIYKYHPQLHALIPRLAGEFHAQSSRFCLGQDLVRDAGAIVIHSVDLAAAVESFGDRAYRQLTIEAGVIGEHLNLSAIYLAAGASGIGGYFDDEINTLLRIPADHAVLYVTVLGVPA